MKEWFKNTSAINLTMIFLSFIAVISFIASSNWHAAIWALNTLFWVLIATDQEQTIKNLRDQISDLYEKLARKK